MNQHIGLGEAERGQAISDKDRMAFEALANAIADDVNNAEISEAVEKLRTMVSAGIKGALIAVQNKESSDDEGAP